MPIGLEEKVKMREQKKHIRIGLMLGLVGGVVGVVVAVVIAKMILSL